MANIRTRVTHLHGLIHVYKCDGSFAGQVVPKDQGEKPLLSSNGNQRKKKEGQKNRIILLFFFPISLFFFRPMEERVFFSGRSIKIYSRAAKFSADFRLSLGSSDISRHCLPPFPPWNIFSDSYMAGLTVLLRLIFCMQIFFYLFRWISLKQFFDHLQSCNS